MTESEWLQCTEPEPMLEFLGTKTSDRKLRLFALACCRRIDKLITDPRSQAALEFAEQYIEVGAARRKGRPTIARAARLAHVEAYNKMFSFQEEKARAACLISSNAAHAALTLVGNDFRAMARYAAAFSAFAVGWGAMLASGVHTYRNLDEKFKRPESEQQTRLLRDIVGNPFRPVLVDSSRLLSNNNAVLRVAQAVYEDCGFDRLPILADALDDAGCDDAEILAHCRSGTEHLRGCWVVDLLLGKM